MAQTEQTLKSFYSAAQKYGFLRDYQARVENLTFGDQTFPKDYLLYIKNFSLPNATKQFASVKYFGVDVHAPGPRDYGNSKSWDVTFYMDQALEIRHFLQKRMYETAVNSANVINHKQVPGDENVIQINVLDDKLNIVDIYRIYGLFVIDLPAVSFDVSGSGKIQEVKVKFGYQWWSRESASSVLGTPTTVQNGTDLPAPSNQ